MSFWGVIIYSTKTPVRFFNYLFIVKHQNPKASVPLTFPIMDVDSRLYEQIAVHENDIHNIVMSYLVHNCFKETFESFIACTGMKQPSDHLEDMENRKRIYQFALEGNALKAIELTEQLATNLLEKNKDLYFDLLSLHFVELVCSSKCTEALEFAQMKLTPFGKEQKYVEKLEDFMALLAYEEPEKSPMFHLLSLEYRQHVADSLNRAILAHANHPTYTAMERLVQQTTIVRQCLNQEHGKDGPPPLSLKDFLNNGPLGTSKCS
ncbi:LisH and RanBPM domains containing protein isoform 2 [Hibiscus syriacus]|uniref:LisH and RanBPM domains containing protein isoform 2 n=1 Tax=Hibiscus syriacus TaxID=106335 RepID=A0A6A3CSD9_HIBSY|nr:glucose-induced degradation protein 8 homolog [Hibiscus syriacus]KAE8731374.1 LisH and RanBPM domains containing protein isoform 2 [Hibiscus syriacus]